MKDLCFGYVEIAVIDEQSVKGRARLSPFFLNLTHSLKFKENSSAVVPPTYSSDSVCT